MTSFFNRRNEDQDETAHGDPDSTGPMAIDEGAAREADLRDQMLRVLAELENVRRRSTQNVDNARRREREEVLRAFIEVLDSFDSALGARGAELNQWIQGFQAIRSQMLAAFQRFGVRQFDPLGDTFDPHQHEAMAMAHLANLPEGQIVEVVQSGYAFEDGSVLRPAKVIVNGATSGDNA